MKEKRKNNKSDLSEFLRYVRGEMTKREEHAFQRKLQKDPFAEEASEGLEGIDPGLAEKDILKLTKQVEKRTSGKQRVLWYRIAASVAILMILSSIFIIVNKGKPSEQIAYSPPPAPSKEIQVAPEQKKVSEITERKEPVVVIPEKSKIAPDETQKPEIKPDKKDEIKKEVVSADYQEAVLAVEAEAQVQDKPVIAERAMASKSALAKGTWGVEYENEDTIAGHISPQPINGRADFDKYIQNNIRRPDTSSTGQRVVVVLNFIVKADGIIDSIRIIRSPGEIFSDEAVRLIREGPAWKPAEENGKVISDEVRIRIVFK
jgi:outer membrane biosynthesis protein TonB